MFSFAFISQTALIAASLVSAAPAIDFFQARAPVSDNLAVQARTQLESRDIQSPFPGLPGCDTDALDPTWAVGQSAWKDGEGKYIGSDCDNHDGGDNHCWTDYQLVGSKVGYNKWYQAMGDMLCDDSGSCAEAIAKLSQSCTTFTWSVDTSLSVEFNALLLQMTGTISVTVGQSYMSCNANTTTTTCTWNGTNGTNTTNSCHSIWAAQQVTTVYGYKRRSCKTPTNNPKANMPNSPQRADGFYTRGIQDFAVPLSGVSAIDCGGTCDAGYHPGELPSAPSTLTPWPQ